MTFKWKNDINVQREGDYRVLIFLIAIPSRVLGEIMI